MSEHDLGSADLHMRALDALEQHAADLARSGRHEDVAPSKLTAEFRLLADERLADRISDDQHEGRWVADPEVNNVWGWRPSTMMAPRVAVVYYRHAADFECDETWEAEAMQLT